MTEQIARLPGYFTAYDIVPDTESSAGPAKAMLIGIANGRGRGLVLSAAPVRVRRWIKAGQGSLFARTAFRLAISER